MDFQEQISKAVHCIKSVCHCTQGWIIPSQSIGFFLSNLYEYLSHIWQKSYNLYNFLHYITNTMECINHSITSWSKEGIYPSVFSAAAASA